MTFLLRHNTPPEAAKTIVTDRCVSARVEPGRKHGYSNGPYFFVDGLPVDEVVSGGSPHSANLYFECDLEPAWVVSAALNSALHETGNRSPYENQLLLCTRDEEGLQFREAIILPTLGKETRLPDCLRLTRYEPADLFGCFTKRRVQTLIRDRTPFSVGIFYD